jgi:hypothetical protein
MPDLTERLDQVVRRVAIVFDNKQAHGLPPLLGKPPAAFHTGTYCLRAALGNISRRPASVQIHLGKYLIGPSK